MVKNFIFSNILSIFSIISPQLEDYKMDGLYPHVCCLAVTGLLLVFSRSPIRWPFLFRICSDLNF